MSERHVTAVVLLSGATTSASHQATADALAAQSRSPDRVIVIAPSSLPETVWADLDRATTTGTVHEVVTTSATISQAGAVREGLDLIARRRESADADAPEAEADLDETAGASVAAGRRAAAVDRGAVERRRTQQAEDLARIPRRLRTEPRAGRRIGPADSDETWLWFLVDASPPGHDALARQLESSGRSPNTAVVGTKRVRYGPTAAARLETDGRSDEPAERTADGADTLVDVGITLTHGGRIITGVDPGEIDQGQADWREDVLAVALPGMLIRERTLRGIGGLDPDLPTPWAEIDLCHRVWRSGERVAVQSSARVLFPDPTRPRLERLQEQRTGQILVLLKHRPVLLALVMLLLSPLTTVLRMAGAIAASVPRRALMEARAWLAALGRAPRVIIRGRRDRRGARVPRGRLAPLYLPRGEGLRRRLDDTWTRVFADDDNNRRIRRTTWGISGTHHGADDADYGRHVLWTVVVALAASVLGLTALRGLFGRGELSGPALLPLPENWRDTWEAAWSSWVPGGLGARGPGDALVRLVGHLPVSGSLLIEILVFAAIPLSALFAWWAAGAITRAVGARLVLAVTWSLAPSLLTALGAGAWPLLLVHMLLPLLALAVGRSIGLPHKVSQASVSAAALAGILLLVIGAVQPVLVLLVVLALALIAPAVPGRRLRLLWVLLPSLALHAPYVPVYLGHPQTLLAVAGTVPQPSAAGPGDLLMLWPVPPGIVEILAPYVGTALAAWLPALPLLPVVIAAIVSPLLAGAAGRAGRLGVLLAAAGLLTVLIASGTATGVAGDALARPAPHGLLSFTLLALGVGAAASFDALARREAGQSRLRRLTSSMAGALVAATCLVTVAGWSVLLPGQLELDRATAGPVPAAAADQGRTDTRTRVLVLEQTGDGAVEAATVVHGGRTVIQQSAVTAARDVAAVRSGAAVDDDPAGTALRESVAGILSSGAADEDGAPSALAVGYVIVPGDPADQADLVGALDASTDLEKVTASATGGMWRVIDAAPHAYVTDGTDITALDSTAVAAHGTVPPADAERTLVLSERYDTQWRATVAGTALEPVQVDGWAQGFTLPAGVHGQAEVARHQPWQPLWQITLYAGLALTVLIAIPWRPRGRRAEDLYG